MLQSALRRDVYSTVLAFDVDCAECCFRGRYQDTHRSSTARAKPSVVERADVISDYNVCRLVLENIIPSLIHQRYGDLR